MQPYQNPTGYGAGYAQTQAEVDQGLRSFMLGVYNNMILGLAISALVALGVNKLAVASSMEAAGRNAAGQAVRLSGQFLTPFGVTLYTTPLMWVIALAPLAFILLFSFATARMSAAGARVMFFAFAAVMGASLSTVLLRYTGGSITQTFFVTAAAFGGLSLYGYTTSRSLSGMGTFLTMALIGLVLASIVNIFLASPAMQFIISAAGVVIFSGLTAYDTQKLKEMYLYGDYDAETAAKASIFGALTLYLDFINLFQFLLSFMGSKNE